MRPAILLGFWRVGKCRGHVLRSLEPFAARWCAQGRSADLWQDPMALGFLVTLITHLADRAAGPLGPDALGDLQRELWGRLTGLPTDALGDQIVALSLAAEPRFVEGSRRALIFAAALDSASEGAPDVRGWGAIQADLPLSRADAQRDLSDLWDTLLADVPAG